MKKSFILLALLFCLVGCSAQTEPEEREYVLGFGIDGSINGGYSIYAECSDVDTKEGESSIYYGDGSSIEAALYDLNKKTANELYLGHSSIIIVNRDLLKNRYFAEELCALAQKNTDINLSTALLCAENTSELFSMEKSPVEYAKKYYSSPDSSTKITKLIAAVNTDKAIDIPYIKIKEDELVIDGAVSLDEHSMI